MNRSLDLYLVTITHRNYVIDQTGIGETMNLLNRISK